MGLESILRRHGDDEGHAAAPLPVADPSYFTHPAYTNWMMAHIAIMVITWVFILPICMAALFCRPSCAVVIASPLCRR